MSAFHTKQNGLAQQGDHRVDQLKAIGLGDFADMIAELENTPAETSEFTDLSNRPGAQVACEALTAKERELFEAQFKKISAAPREIETPRNAAKEAPISFAGAFRLAETSVGGEALQGSGDLRKVAETQSNRIAFYVSDLQEAQQSERAEMAKAPRPRLNDGSGFDLGAYYDRLSLTEVEAQALSRILVSDGAAHGENLVAESDRERLVGLLADLDVDLDALMDSAVSEVEDGRVCEDEDDPRSEWSQKMLALGLPEQFADAPVQELSDGRLALILDDAAAQSLLETAQSRIMTKRAVPEEAPIAGAAAFG